MADKSEKTLVCLKGGTILPFDDDVSIIENGEVWFEGENIVHVGRAGGFDKGDGATILDQTGRLICPGFINAHTHSYSSLLKGTVERDPLDIYMLSVIATGSAMSPREIEVAAMLDAASMLMTGVTGVIDHYSERPALSREGLAAVKHGFSQIGIRATIATMFADKPYVETIPVDRNALPKHILERYASQPVPDAENYFSVMEDAVAENEKEDLIRVILGVDGPQRCSEALIDMTGEFQRRHHCGLHTHMLETKTQAVMAEPGGPGFVRRMLEAGIIDNNSSLVHFIWAGEDDIAAAREGGATVVHCPASNTMLGAGLSPVLRLANSGIPVAFGTDGSNCGPPSLFETMRLGSYLMRLTDPDFENWLEAPDILKSSFRAGARAMGRDGKSGILKPGAYADIVSLDLNGHWHQPEGDIHRHLLHYENGSSVKDVWVNGQHVVRDRKLTTIDIEDLLREAREIVTRRREAIPAEALDAIEAQYPAFRAMIIDILKSDFAIERRVSLT